MAINTFVLGAIQVLAGIFLTATGVGAGLGLKLILSGALTVISGLVTPQGRDGFKSSPTYGFDNIRNTTNEGEPLRVIYGRNMQAPAIISQMVEPDGADQRLKVLCLVGEGRISAITDIRLNDTPIEEFDGVEATRLLGTPDQALSSGWRDIGTAHAANTKLELDEAHTHIGKAETDSLILSLTFAGGLYLIHKDGGLSSAGFNCRVEYAAGDNPSEDDWKPALPAKWVDADGGGYWTGVVKPNAGWKHKGGNRWVVNAKKTQSAYRLQMRLDLKQVRNGERGIHSVRITGAEKTQSRVTNIPTLVNVVEVVSETRNYPNRALLGLVIPATAQLSGGTPRITCLVDGLLVDDPRTASTEKVWSRNPVLCARDLMLSERYGLGDFYASSDLDDGSGGTWRAMADAVDAKLSGPGYGNAHAKAELDLVLDVKAPARDWMSQILTPARLNLFQTDGLLRLSMDADSSSVRTFSEDEGDGRRKNILGSSEGREGAAPVSSLVDRVLPDSQAWTKVRVRYVDRHKDYAQQVLEITDDRIPVDGVIVGGPFTAGERIQVSIAYTRAFDFTALFGTTTETPKSLIWTGYLTRDYSTGDAYMYVGPDDASPAWPEGGADASAFPLTITGLTSKATTGATGDLEVLKPERVVEVQLYGVTRMEQALREARFHLNRAQITPRFCSFGVATRDLDLELGDVFEIYSDRLGWAPKLWMCLGVRYGLDGSGRVEAREHDVDVYLDQTDNIKDAVLFGTPGGSITPGSRPTQSSDSKQAEDQAAKPSLAKAQKGQSSGDKATAPTNSGSSGSISGRKPVSKARNVRSRSGLFSWSWSRRR